ncbi:sodium/glutamate symporter [Gulosibacter sediminis]|uniref:sodium/glutamate symporter n=1 Tax=Gulosibacter sediminis TaxID=1729695 RepID=UPI0024A862FA|nr:sodium/glutamate symporter [Gulosibacter sediminis]
MNLQIDMVQTTALTLILLLLGEAARRRIGFLQRFSFPAPVIGGFLFALVVFALRQTGVAEVEFDTALQTPAMIAFFTTIGLAGSFAVLKKGGRLLLVYLIACWTLAILQNLIGIGMANVVGVDPMLGIMAGSVSLEGGLGAAAAFGPTAEEMGTTGATAVALASATFGLVAGSLLGGPTAGWLVNRHKIRIPTEAEARVGALVAASGSGYGTASSGTSEDNVAAERQGVNYQSMLVAAVVIGAIMVVGILLGTWLSEITGFSFPAYVGAMLIAVIFRNLNDKFNLVKLDDQAVDLISQFTLGFFLTMAMMSLKIWELAALALPLVAVLLVQVAFILVFATQIVFRMMGKNYDAATMVAGLIGHGLGQLQTLLRIWMRSMLDSALNPKELSSLCHLPGRC